MLNNLAALEATADGLTAVEMAAESEHVGRLIDGAETYEQCLRAMKQFDALRRRAIK